MGDTVTDFWGDYGVGGGGGWNFDNAGWNFNDVAGVDGWQDLPFDANNPPPDPSLYPDPGSSGGGSSWLDRIFSGSSGTGLMTGALGLGGALLNSSANSRAAAARSQAALDAARMSSDAYLRGIEIQQRGNEAARAQFQQNAVAGVDAIHGGVGNYAATMAPLLTPTPVMLPTYRGMTDAERIAADDAHRTGMATLAASGLRGAGRAGIGAVMDQDRRIAATSAQNNDNRRLSAMQTADQQAKSARSSLASVYANEGTQIANTLVGQGNQIAQNLASSGAQAAQGGINAAQVLGQGQIAAADASSSGDLANSQLFASALGTIGSAITGSNKNSNRDTYAATNREI